MKNRVEICIRRERKYRKVAKRKKNEFEEQGIDNRDQRRMMGCLALPQLEVWHEEYLAIHISLEIEHYLNSDIAIHAFQHKKLINVTHVFVVFFFNEPIGSRMDMYLLYCRTRYLYFKIKYLKFLGPYSKFLSFILKRQKYLMEP